VGVIVIGLFAGLFAHSVGKDIGSSHARGALYGGISLFHASVFGYSGRVTILFSSFSGSGFAGSKITSDSSSTGSEVSGISSIGSLSHGSAHTPHCILSNCIFCNFDVYDVSFLSDNNHSL